MRLWSLHPRYLDAKGLVALWREALLAQKVLSGATRGYRNHPQLSRFRAQADALGLIAAYLREVQREAVRRGYHFDATRIGRCAAEVKLTVTRGQMDYELAHLRAKLKLRDPAAMQQIAGAATPEPHPLFDVVAGDIEDWEVMHETSSANT
ncbi:MAG TPA: pyrimidine dimer DNA glycosylase/endonuclease V [Gallionella sp.]|nr:pyrimidine dimer DNA glycosylase/endonuclease V [Gallionella sp.]